MDNRHTKLIAKNTIYLYVRMLLSMGVALYTSRVVLDVLGVEDYGIYNVVGGVVIMFSFLNASMSAATQRFLSFKLGLNDLEGLKRIFSAALNIHIILGLIIFVIAETLGLWFINYQLNLPEERMLAVNWVYQFSILAFLAGVIKVPYTALIIAQERMSAYAVLSIGEVLAKLGIVFLLIYLNWDKLVLYSVLTFGVLLFSSIIYILYCRINFSESRYFYFYDKTLYKELVSYSGWSLFGSIAAVAKGQGNNILLNIFYGTTLNAAYGLTMQVQGAVGVFVSNFQLAVNPQIVKTFAKDKVSETLDLMFRTSKLSFFLIYILTLPIILNVDTVLHLWLKEVPEYTDIFVILCLITLLIDSISGSLKMGVQATGKIKYYQIVVGSLIFLNLPIVYFLFKFFERPQLIFVVGLSITVIALVARLYFLKKLMGMEIIKFIKTVIIKILLVVGITLPFSFFTNSFINSFNIGYSIVLSTLITCSLSLLFIFWIGMDYKERLFLRNIIKKKVL